MTTIQSQLQQIKERCAKATPGPWSDESDWPRVYRITPDRQWIMVAQCVGRCIERTKTGATADTDFIAHSREDVERLVRALEKCMEQRDAVRPDDVIRNMNAELATILSGDYPFAPPTSPHACPPGAEAAPRGASEAERN